MAKRGILDHPKTKRLARGLKVCPGVVVGLLETIWHWVEEFRCDGALTIIDFEDALDSGGWLSVFTPDQVIAAMTDNDRECIWLDVLPDGKLFIHDWPTHTNDAVHRRMARAIRLFANGVQPDLSRLGKSEREEIEAEFAKKSKTNATLGAQSAPKVQNNANVGAQSAPCLSQGPSLGLSLSQSQENHPLPPPGESAGNDFLEIFPEDWTGGESWATLTRSWSLFEDFQLSKHRQRMPRQTVEKLVEVVSNVAADKGLDPAELLAAACDAAIIGNFKFLTQRQIEYRAEDISRKNQGKRAYRPKEPRENRDWSEQGEEILCWLTGERFKNYDDYLVHWKQIRSNEAKS